MKAKKIKEVKGRLELVFQWWKSLSEEEKVALGGSSVFRDTLCQEATMFFMSNYWHDDPMYGTESKLERDDSFKLAMKIGVEIGQHFNDQDTQALAEKIVELMEKEQMLD